MPNNLLKPALFLSGLAALCWIAAGYIGASALALSVVLLIGACYIVGGLELHRYRQATAALRLAVAGLGAPVHSLTDWLQPLPASLRNGVRQRIEGERVPLPAPALTPYLVGLLVLLGMLGTLLGMMTTLRGTGLALESATDLDAIRTSLAAPVKGLAFAFGTSIAGVAASAMLGLLSALCRRERADAVQALDATIATTLRPHSRAHQREEAFKLLQRQVDGMPALVEQLQATMAAIQQQSVAANERQVANQAEFHERTEAVHERLVACVEQALTHSAQHSLAAHERQVADQSAFHERTEAIHARLAASVEQSLKASVAESARAASAALQPVAETTMAALAQHAASLHENVDHAMQRQLEDLSGKLHASTTTVAGLWTDALAQQRQSSDGLLQNVRGSLEQFAETFEQRSAGLVDTVATRFETASNSATAAWSETLSRQTAQGEALAQNNQQAFTAAAATFESHAAALIGVVQQSHAALQETLQAQTQASAGLVDSVAARFEAASSSATAAWTEALARQTTQGEALAQSNQQALAAAAATFESHATSLVGVVHKSHVDLQASVEAQARASAGLVDALATRFETASDSATAAWTEALSRQTAQGEALARNNEQALTAAAATFESNATSFIDTLQQSHAQLQTTLEAQTKAHASETIAQVSRLVHDAAEAPKAAAAVIAELRQNLSESLVRDNAMLEERGRLLATVETLLSAVNHASAEQRSAVDALISTSAEALARVATRFTDHVETETGKLDAVADRITAGAIEVASLGDVFGAAVHRFGEANEQLVLRLQAIEGALDQSLARSDEQLAYYVAQAREVVDLSVLAQKQIIGELQQLAQARALVDAA